MIEQYKYTIQIINQKNQQNFGLEKLEWLKELERDLEKNFDDIVLNTWEILYENNVLRLDADIYIKPISMNKLRVGIDARTSHAKRQHILKKNIHWLEIKDESSPAPDALSKLLLLVLGIICIPCATGFYHTCIADLYYVISQGKYGRIFNLKDPSTYNNHIGLSAIAWTNFHGKAQEALNQTCIRLKAFMLSSEQVFIVNPTIHEGLKEASLALLITK